MLNRRTGLVLAAALALPAIGLQGAVAANPPAAVATSGTTPAPGAGDMGYFNTEVRPILEARCLGCHSGASPGGGLQLGSRAGILKGGTSGAAVNLANPVKSRLIRAINYAGPQMPPSGKIPASEIAVLTRWVKSGVPFPTNRVNAVTPAGRVPPPVNAQAKSFWSFRPVKAQSIPTVRQREWVTNPVDAFVLARLEKAGLKPAPPAGKAVLLRRAYYDLTGLPPSPQEVKAFLADPSPRAYEQLIDRLLASPQYGVRWARHWLDLVRYGETNSFERDDPKPFAWRYRDYVIRSLNQDKPYDQFIREQIAGDELAQVTPDSLIATGFYRIGQWDDEPADPLQARSDEIDDILTTTGQAFLGLTVNCARCHDHKIDPIPQKDYYRLAAFFQNITSYGGRGKSVMESSLRSIASEEEQQRYARESKAYQTALDGLNARIGSIEDLVRGDLTSVEKDEFKHDQSHLSIVKARVPRLVSEEQFQEYDQLLQQRSKLAASPPQGLEQALCVKEDGRDAAPTFVLMRGSAHAPGDVVEPGFLSVLSPPLPVISGPAPGAATCGRRLALANWLCSPENPLTARVMVNRIWQHHFGRGIVRSPNNFGFQGAPPTHPELLDWLAGELIRNGWKLKPLHRLIMLSGAYRMSSQGNPTAMAKDPENDLFWRFDMRRLDAEEIRDSVLAINGALNLKMEGPSIYPPIPPEVLAGQSRPGSDWPTSPPGEAARRSIYIHVKRSLTMPVLASFDAPDTDFTCPVRFATTQPTQALSFLNSDFINDQARVFARSVRQAAGDDPAAQVQLALWRVLQRPPNFKEISRGVKLIQLLAQDRPEGEALRCFCVVALNLNEFIYLD